MPGVVDAAGRTGTALQLTDPRLGAIGLIFSDDDGRFPGERIANDLNGTTMFSSSTTRVAVVATVGDLPS